MWLKPTNHTHYTYMWPKLEVCKLQTRDQIVQKVRCFHLCAPKMWILHCIFNKIMYCFTSCMQTRALSKKSCTCDLLCSTNSPFWNVTTFPQESPSTRAFKVRKIFNLFNISHLHSQFEKEMCWSAAWERNLHITTNLWIKNTWKRINYLVTSPASFVSWLPSLLTAIKNW